MPFTGQPGIPCTEGLVQPGYCFTHGVAVWHGPFAVAEVIVAGLPTRVAAGGTGVAVTSDQAAKLLAGDSSWWVMH